MTWHEEQCDAMGVKLIALPIEKPFQGYLDTLAEVFAGKPVDTTEENLQSRTRGAFLMALEQQVRRAGADHRQQERIRGRLRHHLWRHVRRLRADQGPVQDRGVRAGALAQHGRRPGGAGGGDRASAHRRSCARTRRTRTRCRPTTCSTRSCCATSTRSSRARRSSRRASMPPRSTARAEAGAHRRMEAAPGRAGPEGERGARSGASAAIRSRPGIGGNGERQDHKMERRIRKGRKGKARKDAKERQEWVSAKWRSREEQTQALSGVSCSAFPLRPLRIRLLILTYGADSGAVGSSGSALWSRSSSNGHMRLNRLRFSGQSPRR
jgi:hypothetical protein